MLQKEILAVNLLAWAKAQPEFSRVVVDNVKATIDGIEVKFTYQSSRIDWNMDSNPGELDNAFTQAITRINAAYGSSYAGGSVLMIHDSQAGPSQVDSSENMNIYGRSANQLALVAIENRLCLLFYTMCHYEISGKDHGEFSRMRTLQYAPAYEPGKGLVFRNVADNSVEFTNGTNGTLLQWATESVDDLAPAGAGPVYSICGSESFVLRSPRFSTSGDLVISVAFDESNL